MRAQHRVGGLVPLSLAAVHRCTVCSDSVAVISSQGLQTSVSNKAFLTFETLLVWLNEKIPTTAGVKYIFTPQRQQQRRRQQLQQLLLQLELSTSSRYNDNVDDNDNNYYYYS